MISVLIIGFGNSLRTDDGVGWHIAQELMRSIDSPGVEIISCGQLTPDLAEPIGRAQTVIFIDAAQQGPLGQPTWERVTPVPIPDNFSHQLSPAALIALARDLYGSSPEATLVTIAAESFAFGESLSPRVAVQVPRLVADIRDFIAHL